MSSTETGQADHSGRINFTAFILSLSTAALQHLGLQVTGDDKTSPPCVNLMMAQQTIDILALLQDKTQGNLNEQESKLLGTILLDLRIKYVETAKKSECAEPAS